MPVLTIRYPLAMTAEVYERVQAAAAAAQLTVGAWLRVAVSEKLERDS